VAYSHEVKAGFHGPPDAQGQITMDILCQIRGRACPFNEWSAPLDGDSEPFIEKIMPRAFRFLLHVIPCTVEHEPEIQVATTWNKSMKIWQDGWGLAIEMDVEATQEGLGLLAMVESGVNAMSVGLETLKARDFRGNDGVLRREVISAGVDHITLCHEGAYRGAVCWRSDTPGDCMPPRIRNASLRWRLGVIDRDRKRAADRAMVARVLAAQAAAPRRPAYRPEPVTIPPMPEAMRRALAMGIFPPMPGATKSAMRLGSFF
jgi:phage head maturation protease